MPCSNRHEPCLTSHLATQLRDDNPPNHLVSASRWLIMKLNAPSFRVGQELLPFEWSPVRSASGNNQLSYRILRASTLSYSPKDRDGMALSGAYSLTAEIQSIAISNGDFCFMCQSCAHGTTELCHHMMFIFQRSMHRGRIVFMYVVLHRTKRVANTAWRQQPL